MPKADRVQNVQTPGVEATDEQLDESAEGTVQPTLAPDLQALVAREVAKALGNQAKVTARAQPAPLPTQEEALAQVKADPKHRSILSVDGWVTYTAPSAPPFAKA